MAVLGKRFGRFGLTLHPDKTGRTGRCPGPGPAALRPTPIISRRNASNPPLSSLRSATRRRMQVQLFEPFTEVRAAP
jgi:hypothetical protein